VGFPLSFRRKRSQPVNRAYRLLIASLFGCVVVLSAADAARAQVYRGRVAPNRRFLPGSDWWRIYPWSPYNYGRNPYNPIILPYPYPTPYPTPYPYPNPVYVQSNYTPYESRSLDGPDGTLVPRAQATQVAIPHPTGEMRTPPPDAGVIQVRLPERYATVLFNGEKTSSIGLTRYYVTPDLQAGRSNTYSITAAWKKDGEEVTKERQIKVAPGHTCVVDFTNDK
jgi:uncharacterized protein (TIGR03000 family)